MGKIRFCHVIDASTFNPLLYNSIKYSDQSMFDYSVIALGSEGQLQEQMASIGIPSFSLNYTSKWKTLSVIWRLYKYFRKEKIQIVQAHLFNASLMGLFAARLAKVPLTIFTGHHSHEVPLYKKKWLTFIDGISGRWLAKKTIAPSSDMKNIFINEQKIPAEKIEIIPHGFDLENWRRDAEATHDIKKELGIENKIIFGAVGRLFWVKDFETMLKAFSSVAEKRKDVVLLIAGDGSDKEKLKKFAESLGLQEQVIFTGKRKDIAAVMNCFDVFVHTAIAESFGMVFIEAIALGKPVVSTRVGVATDIIKHGENGLLVTIGDVAELSTALEAILDMQNKWAEINGTNRQLANSFAIHKTQTICDGFYQKWLQQKQNK